MVEAIKKNVDNNLGVQASTNRHKTTEINFIVFVFEPHLVMLRYCFWPSADELLLVVLRRSYGMPGIVSGWATCKASALSAILLVLQSTAERLDGFPELSVFSELKSRHQVNP